MSTTRHEAALIGAASAAVGSLLEQVLDEVALQRHDDLYAAVTGLTTAPPDTIWLDAAGLGEQDLGAIRLIRRLLPHSRMTLLSEKSTRSDVVDSAVRLGCGVISMPPTVREVTLALESKGARTPEAPAHDLFAGLMDQLNNPLAAVAGRLQLAQFALQSDEQEDLADNLRLASESVARMQRTIDKLDQLSGRDRAMLQELTPFQMLSELTPPLSAADPTGRNIVANADERLLRAALEKVAGVLRDLATDGDIRGSVSSTNRQQPATVTVSLQLENPFPLPCRPEQACEPFRLNRFLRDPDLGLDLAVATAMVTAQGGQLRPRVETGFLTGFDVVLGGRGHPT